MFQLYEFFQRAAYHHSVLKGVPKVQDALRLILSRPPIVRRGPLESHMKKPKNKHLIDVVRCKKGIYLSYVLA